MATGDLGLRAAILAAFVLVVGACSGFPAQSAVAPPSSTVTPGGGASAPGHTLGPVSSTALPGDTPAAATTRPSWDPGTVSVSFAELADVPGRPLAIANAGDGSGRLFVAEQGGRVFAIEDGALVPSPFLDISSRVSGGGEQGLLGLAFHPDFPADNRVFVDYTDVAGNTVVASFAVDPETPNAVEPGSEAAVLTVVQPYANHNGGAIAFGPDGYLYVALGDGGSGGDPQGNGQRLDTLLGKILRIDVDAASEDLGYAIPDTNPFAGATGTRGEIWLLGLRNPFRFSFDRATGDLWIGDVGQGEWEEIDVARAGASGLNFGWRTMEGTHCYVPSSGCPTDGLTLPVLEYSHDLGCAVIGGHVYRGDAFPMFQGGYLFSDACTGTAWSLDAGAEGLQSPVQVGRAPDGTAGYGEDEAGELYAASLGGKVYRISATRR